MVGNQGVIPWLFLEP